MDLYCERVGPGLLAEPLNAVTNTAFFIAAWAVWALARREKVTETAIAVLTALIVIIGIGSTLFHTFATGWARFLDEFPILVFQLYFLWHYLRRVAEWSRGKTAGSLVAYLAAAMLCRRFPELLNGSLIYAPAFAAMTAVGVYHLRKRAPARHLPIVATGIFVLSIFFRTIDETVCDDLPIGTHFMWHVLNTVVLYLATRTLITNFASASRPNA